MNKREKLERLLWEQEVPEPPAGLLEKIKSEIPSELPSAAPVASTTRPWWAWRLAASLFVLLGVGYLGYQMGFRGRLDQEPSAVVIPPKTAVPEPFALESPIAKSRPETPERQNEVALRKELAEKPRRDREADAVTKLDEGRAEIPTAAAPVMGPAPPPPAEMESKAQQIVVSQSDNRLAQEGVEGGVPGGVVGGTVGGIVSETTVQEASRRLKRAPAAPSTGGTREPNDQPYGDVFFRHSGVNPFVDTEDDPLSTFGLDVDTASYTVARRYLSDGHLPPPEAIRPEEFLNYFNYGDRPPTSGDFAIYSEAATSPFPIGPRYAMIRFGIRARGETSGVRLPSVLTFVVDTSGSMERENRLELVKEALNLLLDQLREDDAVGLISFSNHAQVLLEPSSDHEAIRSAISRLTPHGSTNAADGLRVGYEVAAGAFRRGANNRVIFLSDGVANVGATSAEAILDQVAEMRNRGVMLTTVGVGMGNFNDVLLEQLADRANGNYAYVDDIEEARRIFVDSLTATLQTIAEDARVQVEFNPRIVSKYRLIGYENRDIADERFREDVDGGEIGAGHSVTALYEVKLQENPRGDDLLAVLTLRYRPSERLQFREMKHNVRLSELTNWESASPKLQLATVVAAFAERLKQSFWAKHIDPRQLAMRTHMVGGKLRGDEKVRELRHLTRVAAELIPVERD